MLLNLLIPLLLESPPVTHPRGHGKEGPSPSWLLQLPGGGYTMQELPITLGGAVPKVLELSAMGPGSSNKVLNLCPAQRTHLVEALGREVPRRQ